MNKNWIFLFSIHVIVIVLISVHRQKYYRYPDNKNQHVGCHPITECQKNRAKISLLRSVSKYISILQVINCSYHCFFLSSITNCRFGVWHCMTNASPLLFLKWWCNTTSESEAFFECLLIHCSVKLFHDKQISKLCSHHIIISALEIFSP